MRKKSWRENWLKSCRMITVQTLVTLKAQEISCQGFRRTISCRWLNLKWPRTFKTGLQSRLILEDSLSHNLETVKTWRIKSMARSEHIWWNPTRPTAKKSWKPRKNQDKSKRCGSNIRKNLSSGCRQRGIWEAKSRWFLVWEKLLRKLMKFWPPSCQKNPLTSNRRVAFLTVKILRKRKMKMNLSKILSPKSSRSRDITSQTHHLWPTSFLLTRSNSKICNRFLWIWRFFKRRSFWPRQNTQRKSRDYSQKSRS